MKSHGAADSAPHIPEIVGQGQSRQCCIPQVALNSQTSGRCRGICGRDNLSLIVVTQGCIQSKVAPDLEGSVL